VVRVVPFHQGPICGFDLVRRRLRTHVELEIEVHTRDRPIDAQGWSSSRVTLFDLPESDSMSLS